MMTHKDRKPEFIIGVAFFFILSVQLSKFYQRIVQNKVIFYFAFRQTCFTQWKQKKTSKRNIILHNTTKKSSYEPQ